MRLFVPLALIATLCLTATAHNGSGADTPLPFTLSVCPISKGDLSNRKNPITDTIEGRVVQTCCKGCMSRIEKDPETWFASIDSMMIAAQRPYYPIDTCIVTGEALPETGVIELIHTNRLVRLASTQSESSFNIDPDRFVAQLDELAADAQRKDYPLTKCPMKKKSLKKNTTEAVIAGRLVKFCCEKCETKARKNPAPILKMIDESRDD